MKTGNRLLFLFILFFVVACQDQPAPDMQGQAAPPEKVVQVAVEKVAAQDMMETFTLPGTLEAWEDLTLSSELAGPVRWIGPEEGERVSKGQEILKIDTNSLVSDYERDRVDFDTKNRKLARYRKLAEEQLISQQELDDLKNAVEAAKADLHHSELLVQKSTLKSPVSGIVDRLLVDRGEYVTIGQPLAHVVQVNRLKVLVDVPEKDVAYLNVGDRIRIEGAVIDGNEVLTQEGVILHVAYVADSATRTYRCKIGIDNPQGRFRPGMIVRAQFIRQQLQQVYSAPLYAVLDRDGEKLVFVDEEGIAKQLRVTTGSSIGQRVVITSGLQEGQKLIIKGQQLLLDGTQIEAGGQ